MHFRTTCLSTHVNSGLVKNALGMAESCDQIAPCGMLGAIVVICKFHWIFCIRSQEMENLKVAGPALDRKSNVVPWYVCDCTDSSGDHRDWSMDV